MSLIKSLEILCFLLCSCEVNKRQASDATFAYLNLSFSSVALLHVSEFKLCFFSFVSFFSDINICIASLCVQYKIFSSLYYGICISNIFAQNTYCKTSTFIKVSLASAYTSGCWKVLTLTKMWVKNSIWSNITASSKEDEAVIFSALPSYAYNFIFESMSFYVNYEPNLFMSLKMLQLHFTCMQIELCQFCLFCY